MNKITEKKINITEFAHAKVNLGLDILPGNINGYHRIESLFQKVSLADKLNVIIHAVDERTSHDGDFLFVDDVTGNFWQINLQVIGKFHIDVQEDNTVIKALKLLFGELQARLESSWLWEIELTKNIPFQAGLGGGSSDAATILKIAQKILAEKSAIDLSNQDIFDIALKVGMDVPFFLGENSAIVRGFGEKIEYFPTQVNIPILLFKPESFGIPTKKAYAIYDQLDSKLIDTYRPEIAHMYESWKKNDLSKIKEHSGNVFEAVLIEIEPNYSRLFEQIRNETGCLATHLSGSGSASWIIYNDSFNLEKMIEYFRKEKYWFHLTNLLN